MITASLCFMFVFATGAFAKTERLAIVVANHEGGKSLAPLRYAERDAERVRDVLVDVGDFEKENVVWLIDQTPSQVWSAFFALKKRVEQIKARGDRSLLLFYYSGHAEAGELRLGDEALAMDQLADRLSAFPSDIRLALIDSCGAGAITGQKGATPAPSFALQIDGGNSTSGQAIIASSSASESSQESDLVQGSYFTYYLTSGMRGAADADKSGRVTLEEVYRYAYDQTVSATTGTRVGTQHPTYAYDLKGAGEVVVSEPSGADVVLAFGESLEGSFLVVDEEKQRFVAELNKDAGVSTQLSLPVGQYVIKKRMPEHLLMQRMNATQKGTFVVQANSFERVAFADDYAKGSPIALPEERGFSMTLYGGLQGVFDGSGAFPGMGKLSLALQNNVSEHLVVGADITHGQRQGYVLDDSFENAPALDIVQNEAAFFVFYEKRLGRLAMSTGPRAGLHHVRGKYASGVVQQQVSPLLGGQVNLSYTVVGGLSVGGTLRTTYFLYTVPSVRGIAFVDGLFALGWDF